MAPTTYSCTAAACEFVTPEAESAVAIQLLAFHRQDAHMQVQQPPQAGDHAASTKSRVEKVPRPQIKLGVSQDEFTYFQAEWHYRRG